MITLDKIKEIFYAEVISNNSLHAKIKDALNRGAGIEELNSLQIESHRSAAKLELINELVDHFNAK